MTHPNSDDEPRSRNRTAPALEHPNPERVRRSYYGQPLARGWRADAPAHLVCTALR